MALNTKFEQLVAIDKIATQGTYGHLDEVYSLASKESVGAAIDDGKRTLLLLIDEQNDFMPGIGSLGVTGADGDVERLTKFIYNNLSGITQVMCSIDTHYPRQIFHSCWWEDPSGNEPAPFTIITYDDVKSGKWRPTTGSANRSLKYLKNLQNNGSAPLCIWPYHCIAGSFGGALEGQLYRMIQFHAHARNVDPILIPKGTNPYAEMYGIIRSEDPNDSFVNTAVLNAVEEFDAIIVAGEAEDFCFKTSVAQILDYFKDRPEITQKITFLLDCTSPVLNSARDAFEGFKTQFGVTLANSTDIQL